MLCIEGKGVELLLSSSNVDANKDGPILIRFWTVVEGDVYAPMVRVHGEPRVPPCDLPCGGLVTNTKRCVSNLDPMHAEMRSKLYFWLGGINFFSYKINI